MTLEVNGVTYATDKDGYLAERGAWNTGLAAAMAAADGCALAEDHWAVINYLREYYDQYKIAPAMRVLAKAAAKRLGNDKGNSKYLYQLFPHGPVKQASRYAGLPKPSGCM